jgi:hypothetical protein
MIGYNRLGSNGRLGNQMFQYAGLRGIAAKRNYDWVVPPPTDYYEANYGLFDCFKMSSVEDKNLGFVPHQFQTLKSTKFSFDEEFFENCPDDCNIDDYFQTEKYFKNVEKQIRNDYQFKDDYSNPCKEFISQFNGKVISLHVRRTDYVNLQSYHLPCSLEYYKRALEEFSEEIPVLIFSDDIEWCKKQEIFSGDRFYFSENTEQYSHAHKDADGQFRQSLVPYTDLCLMSLCSDAIVANSSFSWWGAWLISNPNKKIVAPDAWFGPDAGDIDSSDLVPDSWICKSI